MRMLQQQLGGGQERQGRQAATVLADKSAHRFIVLDSVADALIQRRDSSHLITGVAQKSASFRF